MHVKAIIAYDGNHFKGFQRQNETSHTITSAIEVALRSLQINSPIVGSGRTDAGVHATGQVIHFDLPVFWYDLEKLKLHLNRKLKEIEFKHITKVSESFHARFSAKKRIYRYVFKTQKLSIFEKKYISYYPEFDTLLLKESLKLFQGKQDFAYFHKTGSDTHTTIREIYRTAYKRRGHYHFIYFEANGFLRSQVRMMTEIAMRCAQGQISLDALNEQITCKKRHCTHLAPAQGLYLARIIY